jgi:geranylgeranyl pyrophosphate synthase
MPCGYPDNSNLRRGDYPIVVALNVGLIALAITAFAATAFLFVRNEQQMRFLKVMAALSSNTVTSSVT